ncbi:MAG: translation initiation factor IF-3 [Chloroflexota bacterium]
MKSISKDLRVNDEIRAREVRVIDKDGQQAGIMSVRDALRLAGESNLDLVEISPTAKPPVCRIMDFGRFKYEQAKRDKEARKKQRVIHIKEVKMRPTIEDHDFEVWVRRTEKFLEEGDKIKGIITFRGREIVHADLGRKVLDRLAERVAHLSVIERPAKVEGRNMIMILNPKPEVIARAEARAEKEAKDRAVAAPKAPASETEDTGRSDNAQG